MNLDALYIHCTATLLGHALFWLGGWMANILALLLLIWAVTAGGR